LSDVFLYVVEAGLGPGNTRFAVGTFTFLRVCKRWNEIAVGSPQLWVWRIPGNIKAWDLFESRSKDVPLFLTWLDQLPESARNILVGAGTPKRVRQLDVIGTHEQLEQILGTLDSRSVSTTSSIRLQCSPHRKKNNGEYLTRFFSLSFPKLAKLDILAFLPDLTSSILTTSNLTSLTLRPPHDDSRRYTRFQFLQVLQHHPNLKQLDLRAGGLPSVEDSGELVPVVLPHLVDLMLDGADEAIEGFIDLISMSSPLRNVIISFQRGRIASDAARANTAKMILTMYYGCKGLEHPRKATHLTVSSSHPLQTQLVIGAHSHSTSVSRPTHSLELRFDGMNCALAREIVPLFPLKRVHQYSIKRLNFSADDCRRTLQRMNSLLHLRLDDVDVGPVLNALDSLDKGVHKEATRTTVSNH
jgi:hypothetical protein